MNLSLKSQHVVSVKLQHATKIHCIGFIHFCDKTSEKCCTAFATLFCLTRRIYEFEKTESIFEQMQKTRHFDLRTIKRSKGGESNMKKAKYNIYDYYDFKQSVGLANNPLQVKVVCEDYIDETDGECLLFVYDTETLREYSYYEFMREVYDNGEN